MMSISGSGGRSELDTASRVVAQMPTSGMGPSRRFTQSQPLPVSPEQRTSSERPGWSEKCQRTKSLRSSPLRGSKSREAGIRSRGQRWRGGKVNTIRSCIVGVQRMVKNSKDHLAGRHPDAASHIDPAITQ